MGRIPVNNPYQITTEFGEPDSNALFGYHSGVDYYLPNKPIGSPIYAPTTGDLTNVQSPTGGNMVVIKADGWTHRLMHNDSFARENGRVNEGEIVAYSGYTGLVQPKDARGAHCHWDINNQGTYPNTFQAFINPNEWLKQGDNMKLNREQFKLLYYTLTGRQAEESKDVMNNLDANGEVDLDTFMNNVRGYSEYRDFHFRAEGYKGLEAELKELKKQGSGDYKPYDGPPLFVKK